MAARRVDPTAALIGVGVGLVVAVVAFRLIRWPAPGIAIAAGFAAYFAARRLRR